MSPEDDAILTFLAKYGGSALLLYVLARLAPAIVAVVKKLTNGKHPESGNDAAEIAQRVLIAKALEDAERDAERRHQELVVMLREIRMQNTNDQEKVAAVMERVRGRIHAVVQPMTTASLNLEKLVRYIERKEGI
jgi:Na+-translocating ferredoxin:NAD+ oxidoreductase RnfG subunit